jgi:hypothetical protein
MKDPALSDGDWSISTGPGTTSDEAKNITREKFENSIDKADSAFTMAQTYVTAMADVIKDINRIKTSIKIPEFDPEIPENILELIRDIPDNPLTSADYDIKIPDSLAWTFQEEAYISNILTSLQNRLMNIIVSGGAGLASVEQAMFEREAERDALVNEDTKTTIADNWAKRNWDMPGGGLFHDLSQVDAEYQNKRLDKSRAIAEESRKFEIDMEQKAFERAVALEGITHEYWGNRNARKLEASKAMITYGLSIANLQIERLKAKASVYAEVVRAYVAHVGAVTAYATLLASVADTKIKYILGVIQARTAELEAEIRQMGVIEGLTLEGVKAQASIQAQIAASALAAFHASASISSSFSASLSQSKGHSESWSHSENTENKGA